VVALLTLLINDEKRRIRIVYSSGIIIGPRLAVVSTNHWVDEETIDENIQVVLQRKDREIIITTNNHQ
jgi:hypothetical protein